ncbi:MAG: flotillin family protein, partial [Glaciihabitans sp.]|nr:flotillin family protein [Glaciihabitans sp.]
EALRAEGEAEANSIRVKGAAEAESTRAQADALEERADDLLRQQIISQLPAIVRAASEPLSAISNMTVISGDGSGANSIGQNVAGQLATSTQLIKDLVGIDIAEIVTGRATGAAAGRALKDTSPSVGTTTP